MFEVLRQKGSRECHVTFPTVFTVGICRLVPVASLDTLGSGCIETRNTQLRLTFGGQWS